MPETQEQKLERTLRRLENAFEQKVKPVDVERERAPTAFDDEGEEAAEEVATAVIAVLDTQFNRGQVYAVARWIRYLATQS